MVIFNKLIPGIVFVAPAGSGQGLIDPAGQVADQENTVPVTFEFRVIELNDEPEQISWLKGVVEITGVGFTFTENDVWGPVQELAFGVIRYVTVETTFPVLVRLSLIAVVPANWGVVNPVTEPTGRHEAVHVKLAPATSEFSITLNVAPEQIGDGAVLVR